MDFKIAIQKLCHSHPIETTYPYIHKNYHQLASIPSPKVIGTAFYGFYCIHL